MPRSTVRLASAATVVAAVTTTVLVGAAPSGAAAGCTAYASMPASLRTHATTPATLRMTLRGSAACKGITFDNGATAYLVSPSGRQRIYLRWDRFGATETQQLYTGLDESGTWRIAGGRTETYDANSVRIASTWRTTTVRVKPATRHVHA